MEPAFLLSSHNERVWPRYARPVPGLSRVPDLGQLAALVAVSRHGSMSSATRELAMTQQAVSARVRTAERILGLAVFERSTQGVRLTPAGQVVVTWAQAVLDAAASLESGVAALRPHGSVVVRVSASNTISECLLPAWASTLRAHRPDVVVQSRPGNSESVLADVVAGTVDLGYVECTRIPRSLRSRTVARDRLVVVTAPDHRWAAGRRAIDRHELSRTPLVVREPGSGTRSRLDEALPDRVAPALELASTAAVRDAVVTTGAPAVLSSLAVRQDLALGRLVEIPVTDVELPRLLRAVWSPSQPPRGAAADLLRISTDGPAS